MLLQELMSRMKTTSPDEAYGVAEELFYNRLDRLNKVNLYLEEPGWDEVQELLEVISQIDDALDLWGPMPGDVNRLLRKPIKTRT